MIHLFTHVPVTQKLIRPSQLPLLLRDYQVDGSSGVLWLGGIDDSQIIMLLVEGMTIYLAHLTKDRSETVDLSQLPSLLPSRNSIVRTAWLPAEGVRIAKAILDWHPPADTRSCETHDFAALLQDWSQAPGNGVIRVTWTGAEGFVLLAGRSTPATAMYAGSGRILIGAEALSAIHSQPEGPCTVAWYRAPHLPALPEGEIAPLREAFATTMIQLYQNYARLAGVGLMQVLLAELNRKTVGNGWQIRFKANLVEDHQVFPSMAMAVGVYRQLLHEMAQHTSMVVGLQVTDRLFREALNLLPESTRVLLQQYEVV
ncbi:MAG: hypothetical protein JW892_10620 [Anaerolineae bacterium]|nr:hypothetical protein [Anaerolineae bacterium]